MKIKFTLKDILAFLSLSSNMKTIRREDTRGLLYQMQYKGDYYKLLPLLNGIFKAGCTVFAHPAENGDMLLGRNFDLRHYIKDENGRDTITGLITVLKTENKKARYKSIGICDAIYLDPSCRVFREGAFDKKDFQNIRALMLPFLTMDGINEEGLAVSVLHLSTDNSFEEIPYLEAGEFSEEEQKNLVILTAAGEVPDKMNGRLNARNIILNTTDKKAWKVIKARATYQTDPSKESVIHTVLMRRMLDYCQNTDEAVQLAHSVNMISTPDSDNHIVVTDRFHKSVMLEWIDNQLTVRPCFHASNFYNNREDHYGYGYNRDDALKKAIDTHPNGISEEDAMKALEEASQNCLKHKDHGFTQWSAVYNLNQKTLALAVHSDYEKVYRYKL